MLYFKSNIHHCLLIVIIDNLDIFRLAVGKAKTEAVLLVDVDAVPVWLIPTPTSSSDIAMPGS